jgi:eukaryotic-like serine/threonine-protein kinase
VIGTSIGNYRVERLVGEGGMGRVYLAVHPGMGRRAAVKVLPVGEASDPNVVSRFLAEARASNAIRHPNIVDIYDCGVLPDGLPYIVMEYLEGKTLTQRLLEGPIAQSECLDWTCQVAEALAAAHARDVVHRDLKPDNLFLVADPRRLDQKQVKVLDFGIAKLQRSTFGQVHKTRTGVLLGTPLYMSPEQCMGSKDIDARADIYSLGVILYEMVCGCRPFDSDAVFALINMHINDRPVSPQVHRPEVRGELQDIILRALAKSPHDRQASMAELLSQLQLVRGDAKASKEALLRASRLNVTAAYQAPKRPEASAAELRTLADTAVSKGSTAPAASSRRFHRRFVVAGAAAIALLGAAYALSRRTIGHEPRPPMPIHPAPIAPAQPPPPAPPAAPAPALLEIPIDSVPAGANVWAGDTVIGTTPMVYRAREGDPPVELVFRASGFADERMRVLPAPFLRITAHLSELSAAKREVVKHRRRPSTSQEPSPSDIKLER